MKFLTRNLRTTSAFALVAAMISVPAAAGAPRGGQSQRFVLYAVATRAQYIDFSDGVTRAKYQNPFNVDTKQFQPTTKGGVAARPGNSALFAFTVYSSADLKKKIGDATYACTFNFNKHAICQVEYELDNGSLFASGPVDFSTLRSTMAVTGGTMAYAGRDRPSFLDYSAGEATGKKQNPARVRPSPTLDRGRGTIMSYSSHREACKLERLRVNR